MLGSEKLDSYTSNEFEPQLGLLLHDRVFVKSAVFPPLPTTDSGESSIRHLREVGAQPGRAQMPTVAPVKVDAPVKVKESDAT
jgi:hypothetical protein